jgi:hypothetical protein
VVVHRAYSSRQRPAQANHPLLEELQPLEVQHGTQETLFCQSQPLVVAHLQVWARTSSKEPDWDPRCSDSSSSNSSNNNRVQDLVPHFSGLPRIKYNKRDASVFVVFLSTFLTAIHLKFCIWFFH